MRALVESHRLRAAKVDVILSDEYPRHIRTIRPEAELVKVSGQELTIGQKFTMGANANGGPSSWAGCMMRVNSALDGPYNVWNIQFGIRISLAIDNTVQMMN
jgi:hypothetical protein